MRYSENRKDETHAKLVKIAGRALRENGPEGVAVADVMKEAGLTHGGFYAHFKSKDALLVEALESVFASSKRKFLRAVEGLPPRHALATYIDFYVSPRHRDDRGNGCPITALNSDLPRQSKAVRAAFDGGVKSLVEGLEQRIRESGIEGDAHALAASVISAMAGAVAISRAVTDPVLSDQMLATARESIKTRLGVSDADLSRSTLQ
jgi:TetR/AcrR family transcriptional repressor of nem operon